MLTLYYDPFSTELNIIEKPLPEVVANFSEFILTTNLQLNAGTVTVDGFIDLNPTGVLIIGINGIIEIL